MLVQMKIIGNTDATVKVEDTSRITDIRKYNRQTLQESTKECRNFCLDQDRIKKGLCPAYQDVSEIGGLSHFVAKWKIATRANMSELLTTAIVSQKCFMPIMRLRSNWSLEIIGKLSCIFNSTLEHGVTLWNCARKPQRIMNLDA